MKQNKEVTPTIDQSIISCKTDLRERCIQYAIQTQRLCIDKENFDVIHEADEYYKFILKEDVCNSKLREHCVKYAIESGISFHTIFSGTSHPYFAACDYLSFIQKDYLSQNESTKRSR